MDSAVSKQLVDKIYEKRKAAALELEKLVRDCHQQGDDRRISLIIDQLVDMFSNPTNALHVRNGGLIGLAGTAIALGVDVAPYMDKFVYHVLDCFVDPENRIRYFSAECLYNIAKVSKGEVLIYFNEIFDALSKLAADSELSVKNGAELLDRLLKDIVAESASVYIPLHAEIEKTYDESQGVLVPHPVDPYSPKKAFSLAHFIPLLRERIYVVSPFTRSYLVSWITVLDSVPELELISYLPEFLEGLIIYLSDPTEDVRVATEVLLADFLREIRDITVVQTRSEKLAKSAHTAADSELVVPSEGVQTSNTVTHSPERAAFLTDHDDARYSDSEYKEDFTSDADARDAGSWVPGQGVRIDFPAIVEILIEQLDGEHLEIQQSTALRWLAEFISFAPEVMIPFTPRLIPAILPNLAHHASMIQTNAVRTNKLLLNVIQTLPSPSEVPSRAQEKPPSTRFQVSPTPTATSAPTTTSNSRQTTMMMKDASASSRETSSPEAATETTSPPLMNANANSSSASGVSLVRPRGSGADLTMTPRAGATETLPPTSRPQSPVSVISHSNQNPQASIAEEPDIFDYQATVNELTIQFLSEFEETRVAALKWLIMLHQKAPRKILAMDDGTFPALLKTLSDSSEEVIKHDLQLLAQISSSSEETYFKAFMMNLLELFSTDRRLLETRGSLIIRQLCLNLNTERIYKAFAEILEKEDDLEFASVIVQKLNIILITSPELADFRKRLKSLETRQDGQALFTTLYRSWCHNAVAVFSLCLLAQAYEHASNLLYIFADLEITVPMLVQIDKLVQLIESPVFTYIRLQLLEPERYPHLFKCLYGLLMLLPQSSAFVSLRNRLNAVNSAGFLHIAPKPTVGPLSGRSKLARDEIKWQELLQHFRSVQSKHEKARRQALGTDMTSFSSFPEFDRQSDQSERVGRPSVNGRPGIRRKVTGDLSVNVNTTSPPGATSRAPILSPLNPRARGSSGATPLNPAAAITQQAQKGRRTISLTRK
ncbi:ARM repeat-containing protein [Lentinula raphanica]|uniref:ARM repeat-containing protein n=1 Tax=Lentinula raphanica TaxID=153919 RepID=A0AA38UHN6_9AGAR|nr:vacuolar protein 14 C-terminal Fig4p binding-domain-containing protein [Lentinula raphanica]KAJ3776710.1 ARM repeat-containing protein [Lentinula raphanica]KAJ3820817.1 ARM repeat-containing protein [Lentinula raphanica]KAJ3841784.1 ARM repeat-containing protein [Lentinula raphanica]KAJ3967091.1 ARM repeat-containing protein [Lentinula raphanica]